MNIWARIKVLSLSQLVRFTVLFIKHPRKILPTFSATKKSMSVCQNLYGNTHNQPNKANAFRHAFWNYLICEKTHKIIKNDEKSRIWAKKVTELYENVTKNGILDQTMDLHNNEIGRLLFLAKKTVKEEEIVHLLQEMMKKAVKIDKIEEIEANRNSLVYLID